MIRHEFPTGSVEMEPIQLRLAGIDPDNALAAIDRARDDAWQIARDFNQRLDDAEALIRNTGSIFGNAMPVAVDISGSRMICRACTGSGLFPVYNADSDMTVYQTCPHCGGTRMQGPVILPSL